MKPIEFPEQNCIYAKDQPEYQPLPVKKVPENNGSVTSCWQLSEDEILQLIDTGVIYLQMLTFNNPLQPVYLTVEKEEVL